MCRNRCLTGFVTDKFSMTPQAFRQPAAIPSRAMEHLALLLVFTAVLALILQKAVSKFAACLAPSTNASFTEGPSVEHLLAENRRLKGELQDVREQLADSSRKGWPQQSKRAEAAQSTLLELGVSAGLDHVLNMAVYRTAEGQTWHFDEACVTKRSRAKVSQLKPCAVCVPRLKKLFL